MSNYCSLSSSSPPQPQLITASPATNHVPSNASAATNYNPPQIANHQQHSSLHSSSSHYQTSSATGYNIPPTSTIRERVLKRRGVAPTPLLRFNTTINHVVNPNHHSSNRHTQASPQFYIQLSPSPPQSPTLAAQAAHAAYMAAQVGQLPLQSCLAARIPHEVLLRIFSYLMPCSHLSNPMFDDSPMDDRPSLLAKEKDLKDADQYRSLFNNTMRSPNQSSAIGFIRHLVTGSLSSESGGDDRPKSVSANSNDLSATDKKLNRGVHLKWPFRTGSSSSSKLVQCPNDASQFDSPTLANIYSSINSLSSKDPIRIRPYYKHVHPCLLVCRAWYYAAIEYLHSDPVLENVLDFLAWLKCLEATVTQMKNIPVGSLDLPPAEEDEDDLAFDCEMELDDKWPIINMEYQMEKEVLHDQVHDEHISQDHSSAMDIDLPFLQEDKMSIDPQHQHCRSITPTPSNPKGLFFGSKKGKSPVRPQPSTPNTSYPNITAASVQSTCNDFDKRLQGFSDFYVQPPSKATATKIGMDHEFNIMDESNEQELHQNHFEQLRGRPGFAGFAQLRVLRFERGSHIITKYMSYRSILKGSLPSPNQFIRDDHLNRIASAFQFLQPSVNTLDLRNCAHLTDVAIIHLITAVSSKLKHLNVTNCRHIKDVTVRTIARVCDMLEELVLRGCGKVGDASIREVATYLGSHLKVLDVSGCMRINDPGLDYLAKFSGNYELIHWEALRLEAAQRPHSPAVHSPFPPDTPATPTAARAASPSFFRSSSPISPPSSPRPGSPSQQYSASGIFPRSDGQVGGKLRALCLPGIRRQSRGGLVMFLSEMASVHPHINALEFSIPPPPSTSTKSMFSGGVHLFWGLRGLNLTSLTIRDCEYLDDTNLIPIAHYCRNLQSLMLLNVANMTETSFVPLVTDLRQLRFLIMRGAKHLRDPAITNLIQAPCAPFLERLDLSDSLELTDEALFTLTSVIVQETIPHTNIPSTLTVLSPKMPSNAIPVLRSLKHLAMENCRRVTFRGVMAVARILVPYDPVLPNPIEIGSRGNHPSTSSQQPQFPTTFQLPQQLPGPFAQMQANLHPDMPEYTTPLIEGKYRCKSSAEMMMSSYQHLTQVQGRCLISLHVSGAWEGVVTKATVLYRERPGTPQQHRDIHLAMHAVRGLMRDEFDLGTVGSGGSPMLWSIMPATARPNAIWYCRFVRSALRSLLDDYAWIPVPIRVHLVVPAPITVMQP